MKNFGEIDYTKPVLSYFGSQEVVFICLYPFYKEVFADYYNWEAKLEKTYDLIEIVTWEEVAKETGFYQLDRFAKGILEIDDAFSSELKDFVNYKRLLFPDNFSDQFQEKVLIPVINWLKTQGLNRLEIGRVNRFIQQSDLKDYDLNKSSSFKACEELRDAKVLYESIKGIQFLIPDYDSPYCLISCKGDDIEELVEFANLEGFFATPKTKFHWWNQ